MKIIEIDIKEFGGLKNFKRTFSDGANMIFEPNGFGKTTIAAFIKTMLYGFPMSHGADVNSNPRLKMTPWSGSDFGGTMLVETDEGKRYVIERVFSAKGYMDTVRAYDAATGDIETGLLPFPGEKLLKVGGENFDRCVYTPQNRVKTDNDVSLTARLGRALEENGGSATLEKAAGVLKDSLEGLAGEEGRLKKITGEIAKVQKQIKAADSKRAQQLADVKRKADLKAKIVKYEAEIELLKSNTIPQAGINKTAALYQKVERQKQEKLAQIEAMRGHLTGRRLTDGGKEEIQGYLDRIKELDVVAAAARAAAAQKEEAEEPRLKDDLSKKESIEAKKVKDMLKGKKEGVSRRLKFFAWGLMAAAVLLAAGAVTGFILAGGLAGGLLAGAASLAAAAGCWLWYRSGLSIKGGAAPQEKAVDIPETAGADTERAEEIKAEESPAESEAEALAAGAAGGTLSGAPQEAVDANEKALLTEKVLLLGARIFKGADTPEKLERFLAAYGRDTAALESAEKDAAALDDTLSDLRAQLKDADEGLLSRKLTEEDFDVKIPQKRLKYLETSVKNMIAEVGHIEGAAAAGAETPIPRAALKQLYNNLVKDRDEMEYIIYCIDSAIYHLNEGREQLLNNYAPPLKAGMTAYINELSVSGDIKAALDNDLNISIMEKGEPRDLGYFSQGLQDLGYFALRMAMLDLIYKTEKPFIILDEPFVNLDDRHMETARALIKKIAADKQIIYMTSQTAHTI